MPQRAKVSSLKKSCQRNILKNMDSFWCADFLRTMHNQSNWLLVLGPFDALPENLSHELFVALKDQNLLRKHHIQLLLNPFFKQLDCRKENTELSLILQVASTRCQQLKSLDLSWCNKIPKNIFPQCLPSLSKCLNVLNLSHSNTGDAFASVIAVYGSQLRSLDLSYTRITGRAFRMLFLQEDENGVKDDRFGQCKHLRKLNIQFTDVCPESASLALVNCAQMVEFSYQDSIEAVYHVLQTDPSMVFRLSSLSSSSGDINDEMVHAACRACPHVKLFYLTVYPSFNDFSLLPLSELEGDLAEVHITNMDLEDTEVDFVNGLVPVMAKHGHSLVSINLAGVSNINVKILAHFCPDLKHLSLQYNRSYSEVFPAGLGLSKNTPVALDHLRTLKLLCDVPTDDGVLSSPRDSALVMLLSSPALEILNVSSCSELTNELFEMAREKNDFPRLREFHVSKLLLDMDVLWSLLTERNPLASVKLMHCQSITLKDVDRYKKWIKRKGYTKYVEVEWA